MLVLGLLIFLLQKSGVVISSHIVPFVRLLFKDGIGEIGWHMTIHNVLHQGTNLESDPLRYGQEVEVFA